MQKRISLYDAENDDSDEIDEIQFPNKNPEADKTYENELKNSNMEDDVLEKIFD